MAQPDLVDRLASRLGAAESALSHGMPVLVLAPDRIAAAARTLASEFGFDLLLDVTAIDWPGCTPRFDVV
jgi:NADH-quinone oxidoreductase subunit C